MLERNGASGLLARLIRLYLHETPPLIERMKQATTQNDLEALRVAAHSLKSSSTNIGALQLHGLCGALEAQARQRQVADTAARINGIEREFMAARAILRRELPEDSQ